MTEHRGRPAARGPWRPLVELWRYLASRVGQASKGGGGRARRTVVGSSLNNSAVGVLRDGWRGRRTPLSPERQLRRRMRLPLLRAPLHWRVTLYARRCANAVYHINTKATGSPGLRLRPPRLLHVTGNTAGTRVRDDASFAATYTLPYSPHSAGNLVAAHVPCHLYHGQQTHWAGVSYCRLRDLSISLCLLKHL